ncbi:hypothetical protein DMC61_07340 [Amycolatopsis sp. WAC 04169]|uniref:hypothetical protein n=1 Tax=Amycolatopsis sp. WAC 04169 TaxID=2203197 RepID=UPI000F7A6A01|nr:hypothetical protein [Amycolatopsis sp. WAC 04169]RSN35212.1 hypothetical protein DMC61_07340 [Amycolatopsis sp. WAC 04169]
MAKGRRRVMIVPVEEPERTPKASRRLLWVVAAVAVLVLGCTAAGSVSGVASSSSSAASRRAS